jgi:hypothetical protein
LRLRLEGFEREDSVPKKKKKKKKKIQKGSRVKGSPSVFLSNLFPFPPSIFPYSSLERTEEGRKTGKGCVVVVGVFVCEIVLNKKVGG